MDFAQEVQNALGNNPFLEGDDTEGEGAPEEQDAALSLGGDGMEPTAEAPAESESPTTAEADADREFDYEQDQEHDSWQADGISGVKRGEDGDLSALDLTPVQTTLTAHLHGQINLMSLSRRDMVLSKTIIESLDDDGYLRTPLEELIDIAEQDPPASVEELQVALKLVQSCEPAGVAARCVSECLLLQLPDIEDEAEREIARHIITQHLDCLAAKDMAGLSRKTGRSVAEVHSACERIRRLDPRPGWRYGVSQTQYVTPDVIAKKVRGNWTVQLNPAIVPKVRLNHVYAEMFQRHRRAQDAQMATHLQEARWTLRNVEQRFATILSVAQAIIKRQRHFLDYGALAMKPLGLKEIAEEVGLHESTVSRVTNNQYIATPLGVFELKYFFSRTMTTAAGGACSATAIRGLMKDMIEREVPTSPLSDAEIARQLARQGLVVARRTVTKYRQAMRIEAVERRRQPA